MQVREYFENGTLLRTKNMSSVGIDMPFTYTGKGGKKKMIITQRRSVVVEVKCTGKRIYLKLCSSLNKWIREIRVWFHHLVKLDLSLLARGFFTLF